jgi:hypothetical protein
MEQHTHLPKDGNDACVFNIDYTMKFDFVIVVRENHYHKLEKILKHEFDHIARSDL